MKESAVQYFSNGKDRARNTITPNINIYCNKSSISKPLKMSKNLEKSCKEKPTWCTTYS